jgi:hypothetical protein
MYPSFIKGANNFLRLLVFPSTYKQKTRSASSYKGLQRALRLSSLGLSMHCKKHNSYQHFLGSISITQKQLACLLVKKAGLAISSPMELAGANWTGIYGSSLWTPHHSSTGKEEF